MSNEADLQTLFDISHRGYRVRAFYVPETLNDPSMAHVCITHKDDPPILTHWEGYRVFNLEAHFADIVDARIGQEEEDVAHAY